MKNNENQDAKRPGSQDELAKDVARLYSWANLEDATYHEFSREKKAIPPPGIHKENRASQPVDPVAGTLSASASPVVAPLSSEEATHAIEAASSSPGFPELSEIERSARQDFLVVPRSGMRSGTQGLGPTLAVYSIAGGVGKTTLCANLGKTLCALGEETLLVDASGRGILPFYFGATELRAGLRTFVAPGAASPSVRILNAGEVTATWLQGEVKDAMATAQRSIFDLGPACAGLLPEVFGMCTMVLVPLLPDLNSILSVAYIEASLKAARFRESKTITAFYLFNSFDAGSPNDRYARQFVAQKCGERLLPITIRDSREMTEILSGGIAEVDYAPGSGAAHDYLELALWLRKVAPIAATGMLSGRWSER
jgi:cellulose synthase operon protein YhjQ